MSIGGIPKSYTISAHWTATKTREPDLFTFKREYGHFTYISKEQPWKSVAENKKQNVPIILRDEHNYCGIRINGLVPIFPAP